MILGGNTQFNWGFNVLVVARNETTPKSATDEIGQFPTFIHPPLNPDPSTHSVRYRRGGILDTRGLRQRRRTEAPTTKRSVTFVTADVVEGGQATGSTVARPIPHLRIPRRGPSARSILCEQTPPRCDAYRTVQPESCLAHSCQINYCESPEAQPLRRVLISRNSSG